MACERLNDRRENQKKVITLGVFSSYNSETFLGTITSLHSSGVDCCAYLTATNDAEKTRKKTGLSVPRSGSSNLDRIDQLLTISKWNFQPQDR